MFESEIPQTYRTKYRDSIRFRLQQGDSKLRKAVTELPGLTGDSIKIEDILGDVVAYRKKGRNALTEYLEVPHDGRWLFMPEPIVAAELVDKQDKLASGIDIEGGYTKVNQRAIARGTDDIILGGIFGAAQTGKKGTVQVPFDASNVIDVDVGSAGGATPTGLNLAKLSAAWETLTANYVDLDMDELWMAITAKQAGNLMAEMQVTNKDYAARGDEIRDGKLHKLFGFNFVHIELGNPLFENASLTTDGSGYRKNPFWAKSGVALGLWEELFTDITRLPTRHYSAQVYASRTAEATRTDEGKVGYILNDES